MGVLPACISVHHMCVWYPRRTKESVGSPRTGATDGCEPPYEFWEWKLVLKEQPVLRPATHAPSCYISAGW